MQVLVNGEPKSIDPSTTVSELLDSLDLNRDGVAVAVDQQIVPRASHGQTTLHPGAEIEVIRAVGGG